MKLKLKKLLAFMYLWLWWSTYVQIEAANDSLKAGDTLNFSSSSLYSENGKYSLNVAQTGKDENYYLFIASDSIQFWISDRNQPVDPASAILSLNHSGVLKIESQHVKPIVLYSPPQPINNTVANLLNSRNFVLQQLHPNRTKTLLWQSFDYPADTLIPTMKLGVNHKTGHRWLLVSSLTVSVVTPGAFSLEWEPVGQELIIRRREKVSWRSGKLMSTKYAMEGVFSTKSDVYSFGVLLLEIISGRRNTSFYDADHPLNLIGHAWELWNDGQCQQLVDPSLNESFDFDEVQRCIHIGLLCVEHYATDRPTMSDVISMLTNKSAIVSLPQKPAFYVQRDIFGEKLSSKELCTASTQEITTSFLEIDIR